MATRALIRIHVNVREASAPREGPGGDTLPTTSLRRCRGFSNEDETVYVSTKAGLQGAKAAMVALGIEAAAVAVAIGVWFIHSFISH